MAENNKIISFADRARKKRNKVQYELKSEISVYISRNSESYSIHWYSPDSEISEEEIYITLKYIFYDLIQRVDKINYKKYDYYEINFTFLYYEKSDNSGEFKYICLPQNITEEKLVEYLYIALGVYEFKKDGDL